MRGEGGRGKEWETEREKRRREAKARISWCLRKAGLPAERWKWRG